METSESQVNDCESKAVSDDNKAVEGEPQVKDKQTNDENPENNNSSVLSSPSVSDKRDSNDKYEGDKTESSASTKEEGLVLSPNVGRKVRPPVLRNFQLSTFTGQIQEQKSKYLPPPRIRKSSDESLSRKSSFDEADAKPSKPIRKKNKRKADLEKQKLKNDKNQLSTGNSKNATTTFEFKFIGYKAQVQVVGSFNNWIPEDLHCNNNGVWSKHIELNDGTYSFR